MVFFLDEDSDENGYDHHQRSEDERRSWHELRQEIVLVLLSHHQFVVVMIEENSIGVVHQAHLDIVEIDAVVNVLRLVVQINVEQVEDNAKHRRTEAIAEPSHTRNHSLYDALLISV